MMAAGKLLFAAAALALLTGCSSVNNLLGQTDNTVLPGQREDAIPGRTQFPEKQDVAVSSAAGKAGAPNSESYCKPDDPACKPPGTTGDTFKDPQ
jgi:outer membrane biogenesis lipoprotein LolB